MRFQSYDLHRGVARSAVRLPVRFLAGFGLSFLVFTTAIPVCAQQSMPAGHNMADMQPVPPPEQLPAPIHMTGIGNSHITIKASPEAQAWFDQGLSLLHDFWDYESAKAFEQAIRTDPNCAMCYWGLAQAVQSRGMEEKLY